MELSPNASVDRKISRTAAIDAANGSLRSAGCSVDGITAEEISELAEHAVKKFVGETEHHNEMVMHAVVIR